MLTSEHMAAFFGKPPEPKPDHRRQTRERILKALLAKPLAPREIQDALFDLDAIKIMQELRALVAAGVVQWNEQYGPASRYSRQR